MAPIGLGEAILQPGERAVVPVKWTSLKEMIRKFQEDPATASFVCSTHPEAPKGLKVLEGPCPIAEEMSICIENDSPLPIVLTEKDDLAVAVDPEDLPTLDACARVQARREKFYAMLDWNGGGEDVVKIVDCPKQEKTIVGVIHRIPRFASMKIEELPEEYRKQVMGCQATRITTLTYL